MRIALAAFALTLFAGSAAFAECTYMQTAQSKAAVVAKADQQQSTAPASRPAS